VIEALAIALCGDASQIDFRGNLIIHDHKKSAEFQLILDLARVRNLDANALHVLNVHPKHFVIDFIPAVRASLPTSFHQIFVNFLPQFSAPILSLRQFYVGVNFMSASILLTSIIGSDIAHPDSTL
jgi:hypothetical protein